MYQNVPEWAPEVASASGGGSNRGLEGLPVLYSSPNIIRVIKTKKKVSPKRVTQRRSVRAQNNGIRKLNCAGLMNV